MQDYIDKLRALKAEAAGSDKEVEAQHKRGRLTARERIDLLFDPGTFNEIDTLVLPRYETLSGRQGARATAMASITGFGLINGRHVVRRRRRMPPSWAARWARCTPTRSSRPCTWRSSYGCPFIALNDSGGARIQEGVDSLGGYARIFDANCEASGVIPQLSVILGPCAGGAVYSPGAHRLRLHDREQLYVHHRARRWCER